MKKPSAARGHMTPEEIATHLDHAKIDHLQKILKKEKLLSPETKKNVNLALAEIYERVDPKKAAGIYKTLGGASIYDHFGGRYGEKVLSNLGLSEEAVTILEAQRRWGDAARLCDKIANDASDRLRSVSPTEKEELQRLAWRSYRRASGLYEKVEDIEQAAITLRLALNCTPSLKLDIQGIHADAIHLGELSEKVADKEERRAEYLKTSEDKQLALLARRREVHHLELARAYYEFAGDSENEKRVERRLGSGVETRIDLSHLVGAVAILSLCGGVLFLSPTITGNTIITQATSSASASWLGGVLILAGIVGVIGYVKLRRR